MCFSSPSVQPAPPMPSQSDAEVQAAMEKERALARLRRGRRSTILTSGLGVGADTGGSATTAPRKTILSGER
jgi:hypothetical protein